MMEAVIILLAIGVIVWIVIASQRKSNLNADDSASQIRQGYQTSARKLGIYKNDSEMNFIFAIQNNDMVTVQRMLKVNPSLARANGNPLCEAAKEGRLEICEFLLANDVDANAIDNFYMTPLHYAAHNNEVRIGQLLIEHGANVNMRDDVGKTPLALAENNITASLTGRDMTEMVSLLKRFGGTI
ncbi:MAG: ankyrin repeat domain-containing protein [Armatimonadota bacterium]